MGRFMSPDPTTASFHPENPQTLNRYLYALNNPLNTIDPDGKQPITITVYTWIPYKSTWMFGTYSGGPKTVSTFTVETDPKKSQKPITKEVEEKVQPTVKMKEDGSSESKAAEPSASATATRIGDTAVVDYSQSDKNPLSPVPSALTPSISVNMTLTLAPNGSAIGGVVTASDYPAMQITATYENGDTQLLYSQTPSANTTLLLFVDHTTTFGMTKDQNICGSNGTTCQAVPGIPQKP